MTGPRRRDPGFAQVFGANLARCREALGVSQEDLGLMADLHRTAVGQLERGAADCPRGHRAEAGVLLRRRGRRAFSRAQLDSGAVHEGPASRSRGSPWLTVLRET